MKTSLKLIVLIAASAISATAMADNIPNHQWQRPPFHVVQKRVVQRMEMAEQALPGRIKCVEAATNFKALHTCFPHPRWHHHP